MLALLLFASIIDWKMQKKFKNRWWKSRACVPLMSTFIVYELEHECGDEHGHTDTGKDMDMYT